MTLIVLFITIYIILYIICICFTLYIYIYNFFIISILLVVVLLKFLKRIFLSLYTLLLFSNFSMFNIFILHQYIVNILINLIIVFFDRTLKSPNT